MSFDLNTQTKKMLTTSLNPFGTGQCLSTEELSKQLRNRYSLNPFGTGQCLSTFKFNLQRWYYYRLNPFGTGQCLST